MADYQYCRVERDGRLLIVTLNRPEVMNALHRPAHVELAEVFDGFAADPDSGSPSSPAPATRRFPPATTSNTRRRAIRSAIRRRASPASPSVSTRQAADRRGERRRHGRRVRDRARLRLIIASENAVFALPEPSVGLAALAGGLHRLPRKIALKQAMGMILTGRRVPAREGKELGFVNEVVGEGQAMAAARRWAAQILNARPCRSAPRRRPSIAASTPRAASRRPTGRSVTTQPSRRSSPARIASKGRRRLRKNARPTGKAAEGRKESDRGSRSQGQEGHRHRRHAAWARTRPSCWRRRARRRHLRAATASRSTRRWKSLGAPWRQGLGQRAERRRHRGAAAAGIAEAAAALGGLDIFVPNVSALAVATDEASWRKSFDLNVMSTVIGVETALPLLEKSGAGAVVIIGSVAAVEVVGPTRPYNAVKAALLPYMKSTARNYAGKNVRVNMVSPGTIYFKGGVWHVREQKQPDFFKAALARNPMGRMGKPEEVADAVVFLASPRASFITGANVIIDGAASQRVP